MSFYAPPCSLIECAAQAQLAAADGAAEGHVGGDPEGYVEEEQQRDVHMTAEGAVGGAQGQTDHYDRGHGRLLGHAEGKELVVDMGLVGKEGVAAGPDPVEIHADHVAAGDQQRGEGYHCRIHFHDPGGEVADEHAHDAQQEADCQRSGVPHEDLAVLLRVAEDVVVEEGYQRPEGAEGHHPVDVQSGTEEYRPVEAAGDGAQAGGEPVDAVLRFMALVMNTVRRIVRSTDTGNGIPWTNRNP